MDAVLPWQVVWQGTQSNLFQQIQLIGGTNRMMFFRAAKVDPIIATLTLAIDPVTHRPRLSVTALPNRAYVIQSSTNLQQWTALVTDVSGASSWQYLDTSAPAGPQRFLPRDRTGSDPVAAEVSRLILARKPMLNRS